MASQPASQDFRDAPCLCDTAARSIWRFGVEDLANRAHARLAQMGLEAIQEFPDALDVLRMYFEPSVDEWTNEPSPHRPLVISRISRTKIAIIGALVILVILRERSQANRS